MHCQGPHHVFYMITYPTFYTQLWTIPYYNLYDHIHSFLDTVRGSTKLSLYDIPSFYAQSGALVCFLYDHIHSSRCVTLQITVTMYTLRIFIIKIPLLFIITQHFQIIVVFVVINFAVIKGFIISI